MSISNDDHPIRIESNPNRVRVRLGGQFIVDTKRALTLYEATYPGVHYVPREDVDMSLFSRNAHTTQCPYKGEASYYTVKTGQRTAENAVWTYEKPKPVAAKIAGYLAFDPKRVDSIEVK